MENKNTNSTNSNRDENYIGRASSRKKENSSHGSEQSHGQNHSKSINRGHGQSEHAKAGHILLPVRDIREQMHTDVNPKRLNQA